MSLLVFSLFKLHFTGLAKIGLIIAGICFLLLLVSIILLHSGVMSGISIVGILIGVALILIPNLLGNGTGSGGTGDGNGTGTDDAEVVEVVEPVETVQPVVTPEAVAENKNEIIIEINTNNIFVAGVKCEDAESILAQLNEEYTDKAEIVVVNNYADHKAYTLVIDTLDGNNYPYIEKRMTD